MSLSAQELSLGQATPVTLYHHGRAYHVICVALAVERVHRRHVGLAVLVSRGSLKRAPFDKGTADRVLSSSTARRKVAHQLERRHEDRNHQVHADDCDQDHKDKVPDPKRPPARRREILTGEGIEEQVECVRERSEESRVALQHDEAVVNLGKEDVTHEEQRAGDEEEAQGARSHLQRAQQEGHTDIDVCISEAARKNENRAERQRYNEVLLGAGRRLENIAVALVRLGHAVRPFLYFSVPTVMDELTHVVALRVVQGLFAELDRRQHLREVEAVLRLIVP